MQGETVTHDLARGIGRVVHAKTYDRIVAGGRTLVYVKLSAALRRATVFLWQRGHSGSGSPAKSLVSCQPGGGLLTCTAPSCVWMRPQRHTYRAKTLGNA
jgi:hypothetical protein